jgi:signal transduction histidine kinase
MDVTEIVEYAEIINKSGYQLLGVVNDLMDITLIEAGQLKIVKENTDFHELLIDIHKITSAELNATTKKIRLELNIPNDIKQLSIYTDRSRLKQILLNILKNAVEFTDQGHIIFGYEIVTIDSQSMIRAFVEDSGIGIPNNMKNTIFEPFRQVEESATKQHGGAGVGLSISKKFTEMLGGKIWVISEEGQGSTFYVSLPME